MTGMEAEKRKLTDLRASTGIRVVERLEGE